MVGSGDGGDGVVSFRREKYVPFGGPDGGDGGAGGSVYVMADRSVATLRGFRRRRVFKAASGRSGGKQKRHGAKGDDVSIMVPFGTMVFLKREEEETLLADLSEPGQRVLVARGGSGGLGNCHFATARNQAPKVATLGASGEEQCLILDLKLIADVGIIGYPNVGKSTLLAGVSEAKPQIADYAFTTREPALGVAEVGMKTLVVAEIPGLIDGAHLGKGLGFNFLRHAERTKVLLHLLDGGSLSPVDDMNKLNDELRLYRLSLAQKPQLVAVNKIDLPEVQARLSQIQRVFGSLGLRVFFISAATKQGLPELLSAVAELVDMVTEEEAVSEAPLAIFRPQPRIRGKKWT